MHRVQQAVAHAVTEVKEYHRNGRGHAAVAQQHFHNVSHDHNASSDQFANQRSAVDRQVTCRLLVPCHVGQVAI